MYSSFGELNDSKVSVTGAQDIAGIKKFTDGIAFGNGVGSITASYDPATATLRFR